MSIKKVLWCQEGIHDKVWGIISIAEDVPVHKSAWPFRTNKYVTFWGRRGTKLQTKMWNGTNYDADELARKKLNKGYDEIDQFKLNEVYPEFQQDLEKTEFWSKLKM
jgi:predicted DNA-binding WGR domain protein